MDRQADGQTVIQKPACRQLVGWFPGVSSAQWLHGLWPSQVACRKEITVNVIIVFSLHVGTYVHNYLHTYICMPKTDTNYIPTYVCMYMYLRSTYVTMLLLTLKYWSRSHW